LARGNFKNTEISLKVGVLLFTVLFRKELELFSQPIFLSGKEPLEKEIHEILDPFLRSDTETDFPRPVRSVKRSRFAATVFFRSKPVPCVPFLPPKFMFLTEKTKSDVAHIETILH